jgi:cell filamentation protein
MFCLPQHLESFSAEVFGTLAKENWLRGLDRESFPSRLAFHFGEVNAIHPFREGNGRAQRAFFGQLARDAGYPLAWRRLDGAQNISASIAIMRGDPEPMRLLLDALIE